MMIHRLGKRPIKLWYRVKVAPFYWLFCLALFIVIYAYNIYLIRPAIRNYSPEETFGPTGNIHDHFEYTNWISVFTGMSNTVSAYIDNIAGISLFYVFLGSLFSSDDFVQLSLIVNSIAFFLCAFAHLRLANSISDRQLTKYLFFLNLPLIYFCQLVNKDILYITILELMLLCYIEGRWFWLFVATTLGAVIRTQAFFILLFLSLLSIRGQPNKRRLFLAYLIAAIVGAIAFVGEGVLGQGADMGNGISAITYRLNASTYLGNFLFNPIRLLQYILEFVITAFSSINLRINFFALFLVPYLVYFISRIEKVKATRELSTNPVSRFVFCLILVLLMVPIINLRYFVDILPFVVLAINYRRTESRY